MAPNGYLALVLHAHLPYVRHPEYDEFLEEDWLYEAIAETYLPLLDAFLLEKALYEIRYEVNNRPKWVGIPLRGVLSLLEGEPRDVEAL